MWIMFSGHPLRHKCLDSISDAKFVQQVKSCANKVFRQGNQILIVSNDGVTHSRAASAKHKSKSEVFSLVLNFITRACGKFQKREKLEEFSAFTQLIRRLRPYRDNSGYLKDESHTCSNLSLSIYQLLYLYIN